jgi:predicted nucleotidyltransferase
MLADTTRGVAERFKRLLVERAVPLDETTVFGSRARGDSEPESDLDVLVVVEHLTPEIRRQISDCAWEAGFDAGIVVQSVVLTRDQIERGPERDSLLMAAAREEGIPI